MAVLVWSQVTKEPVVKALFDIKTSHHSCSPDGVKNRLTSDISRRAQIGILNMWLFILEA